MVRPYKFIRESVQVGTSYSSPSYPYADDSLHMFGICGDNLQNIYSIPTI